MVRGFYLLFLFYLIISHAKIMVFDVGEEMGATLKAQFRKPSFGSQNQCLETHNNM